MKKIKKLLKLVDFLQDNTGIAEYLMNYGVSDARTKNNPEGEYAVIERYLTDELDRNNCWEEIEDLIK